MRMDNEQGNEKSMMQLAERVNEKCKTVEEEEHDVEMAEAWDDVSGKALDPKQVRKARGEEIDYVHEMGLYVKVLVSECYKRTGKAPITVRWIDINKGDSESPNYRSRLVAREINTCKRDDLFAATPPPEALKIVISMTATGNKGEAIMTNDISRAYFHAKAERDVYVKLPDEDRANGEEQLCGKLQYSMYGTRGAARNWFHEYSQQLIFIGFRQELASPGVFFHKERGIRTFVHGDDYVSSGMPKELEWMRQQLEMKYQVKTEMLGPEEHHSKQVRVLNRILTWEGHKGIGYEVDPRHAEIVIEQLNLKDAKSVNTPGTKDEGHTAEDHHTPLEDKEATMYRAIVARCNYLAPDRPDIAYSVKELARQMSSPRQGDMQRLKRLGRYLKGRPRLQQMYGWQKQQEVMRT